MKELNLQNKDKYHLYMQIIFVTFGGPTENYHGAVTRICEQASNFNIFDKIIGYTDLDLKNDTEFWSQHGSFMEQNKRGYGYWLWKSYLNYKTLSQVGEGDIIIYADAGCELRPQYAERMREYIELAKQSPHGIVNFCLNGFGEKHWTKRDVFHQLDCTEFIEDNYQIVATSFIYRKCANTDAIMKKWYESCCNYKLLNDSPSSMPNDETFIENRHDQSIFSLLLKKMGAEKLEFEIERVRPTPIWAAHNYSVHSLL